MKRRGRVCPPFLAIRKGGNDNMIVRHIRNKNYGKKKRVAAYCRVSTDKAEQEESFETQIATYERVIRNNPEWEYAGIYADEGKSATSADHRPEFQRMIADALDEKIDVILVKSISRFSRNIVDCQTYVEKLREKGVSVRFERENIDSLNPACSMMFSLLAAIAQDESLSISENVKWAVARRFERGEYKIGNNQVLGYDADEDGKPVPNGDAWIVRRIFQLFTEGKSVRQVAELVTAEGGHGLRSEGTLSYQTVLSILQNEIYVGDRCLQKRPPVHYLTKKADPRAEYKSYYLKDVHTPLIEREMWEKAQAMLTTRQERMAQGVFQKSGTHFLYGRVFCGQCGAPYKRRTVTNSHKSGAERYYKVWNCKERQKGVQGKRCLNPTLHEAKLLEMISQKLGWEWSDMEHFDAERFLQEVERVEIMPDGEIIVQRNTQAA